jgi:hypothetical protein
MLNNDYYILVSDGFPELVKKSDLHRVINQLLKEKSYLDWLLHVQNCYRKNNNYESIMCLAKVNK